MGGAGRGWVDHTVVLEECERTLFPSLLIASNLAVLAPRENGTPEQLERQLGSPDVVPRGCRFRR